MLLIILSWIYITCLSYVIGVALHAFLQRAFDTERADLHFTLKCLSGLAAITFVSMLSCLFMPLGGLFQLVLLLITAVCAISGRSALKASWKADCKRWQEGNWIIRLMFIAFIFVMAKLSYAPSSHHDDGLYYSTTIKWLQEYGTVKGLANLNPRIAFNSSWHILQAAFGFPFLHLGLFNDMNGLLFLLVLLYSMGGILALLKGQATVQNLLRTFFMLPVLAFHFHATSDIILFNVNFISSSSADVPACLLTWMIFLLFLEGAKGVDGTAESRHIRLQDILVIGYSVWVLTIKLSYAPILILSGFILVKALIARQIKTALYLGAASLLFLIPWITRTALLSGYLFFPFSRIDLLHVAWKLPLKDILWHENAVKAFPLGADLNRPFDIPFSKWFPAWFAGLDFIRQVVLGSAILSFVGYAVIAVRYSFSGDRQFFARHQRPVVFVLAGTAGILFWLLKGPDFRFGYGFLCIYDLFFLVLLCQFFLEGYSRYLVIPALLYAAALLIFYYKDTWTSIAEYFKAPLPYRMPAGIREVKIPSGRPGEELPLYLVSHDDSWNAPLPVANENEYGGLNPAYIGTSINDGFRSQELNKP